MTHEAAAARVRNPRRRSRVPKIMLPASAIALCLLLAPPGAASPPPTPPSPVATPGWTAEDHYRYAQRSLERGRSFARAALHLEEAVRLAPENPTYRSTLGCAYASRACSLAYAHFWKKQNADQVLEYPDQLKDWEEARAEAEKEGVRFDIPRPEKPAEISAPIPLKDDGKSYLLREEQFQAEWRRLTEAALVAWQESIHLAKTDSETAEAEYTRAWGLRMLSQYTDDEADEEDEDNSEKVGTEEKPKQPISPREAIAGFKHATKLAPDAALYWRALGDAQEAKEAESPSAREAYLTALDRDPKDAALWYRLAIQDRIGHDTTKRARVIGYLENAAKADPANPAPLLMRAYFQFQDTPYQTILTSAYRPSERADESPEKLTEQGRTEANRKAARDAIATVERANLLPTPPRSLPYRPAVPKPLRAAWAYLGDFEITQFGDMTALRSLSRSIAGYARFLADTGEHSQARRTARASLTMGMHLIGDWPVRDRSRSSADAVNVMIGFALSQNGYSALLYVLDKAGDSDGLEQATRERDTLKERYAAWQKAHAEAESGEQNDPLALY